MSAPAPGSGEMDDKHKGLIGCARVAAEKSAVVNLFVLRPSRSGRSNCERGPFGASQSYWVSFGEDGKTA